MASEMEEEVTRGWLNETSSPDYCPREQPLFNNRKLYVGFFRKNLNENQLRDYFTKFGNVEQIMILKDGFGVSRGFGFVTFSEESSVDTVLANKPHILFNVQLETRRAFPRDVQSTNTPTSYSKTKIFIGGLPKNAVKSDVSEFFESLYSISPLFSIENISIPVDNLGRPKGFAFVTFSNEDIVDKIMFDNRKVEICGKVCEIKRVELREDEINTMNNKPCANTQVQQARQKFPDENAQQTTVSSVSQSGLHLLSSTVPNNSGVRLISGGVEKMRKSTIAPPQTLLSRDLEPAITSNNLDAQEIVRNPESSTTASVKRNYLSRNETETTCQAISSKLDQATLANIGSMFIELVANSVESYGNTSAGQSMSSLVLTLLNQIMANSKK